MSTAHQQGARKHLDAAKDSTGQRNKSSKDDDALGVLVQRALAAPETVGAPSSGRLLAALGPTGIRRLVARTNRRNVSPRPDSPMQAASSQKRISSQISNVPEAGSGRTLVQGKLSVGPVDDGYEQEAERMARRVVAMPDRTPGADVASVAGKPVQRSATQDGFQPGPDFERQLAHTAGRGRALPDRLRAEFEPKFGADFGNVRVHTGPASARLSQTIQAKAFTHGADIHFGQGEYQPSSQDGKTLIAHELTHTLQQSGGKTATRVSDAGPATTHRSAVQRAPGGVIQRSVKDLLEFWEGNKGKFETGQVTKGPSGQRPEALDFWQQQEASTKESTGRSEPTTTHLTDLNSASISAQSLTPFETGSLPLLSISADSATPLAPFDLSFFSESLSTLSSSESMSLGAPANVGGSAPGAKYGFTRSVDKNIYGGENADSLRFIATKVFQKSSPDELFALPQDRLQAMLNSIGWRDNEIKDFLDTKQSKVQYLETEEDRKGFELVGGNPLSQGDPLEPWDTSNMFAHGAGQGHGIFVMGTDGKMYGGSHRIGLFHHSSFLAASDVAAAGTMKVIGGRVEEVTNKTGHYMAEETHLYQVVSELKDRGVSPGSIKVRSLFAGWEGTGKEFMDENRWRMGGSQPLTFDSGSDFSSTETTTSSSSFIDFDDMRLQAELDNATGGDVEGTMLSLGVDKDHYGNLVVYSPNRKTFRNLASEDMLDLVNNRVTIEDLRPDDPLW